MKKLYILLIFAVFAGHNAFAQNKISADSVSVNTLQSYVNKESTGNSKDLLTDLIRASINNLLGKGTSFELNTTLYGIDSIFHAKHSSNIDSDYSRQRFSRSIQINLAVKADSVSNKITTFSGGVTISLINKRDPTYGDFSILNDQFIAYANLEKSINRRIAAKYAGDLQKQTAILTQLGASWTQYGISNKYEDLDPLIKAALTTKEQALLQSQKTNLHTQYVNFATYYARRALLTVSPNYSYNRINKQSAISIKASFLDGIGNSINSNPWEFEANSIFAIQGDSTIVGPNLKNRPFTISSGVNKVLAQNTDKVSTMELKGYFEYDNQFGDIPTGTEKTKVTFNTTFRVKVFGTYWIPLTLSYDIKHPNLFGFLSFTANIDK